MSKSLSCPCSATTRSSFFVFSEHRPSRRTLFLPTPQTPSSAEPIGRGSAAFNLFCISAVCVLAIKDNEVRPPGCKSNFDMFHLGTLPSRRQLSGPKLVRYLNMKPKPAVEANCLNSAVKQLQMQMRARFYNIRAMSIFPRRAFTILGMHPCSRLLNVCVCVHVSGEIHQGHECLPGHCLRLRLRIPVVSFPGRVRAIGLLGVGDAIEECNTVVRVPCLVLVRLVR